MVLYILTFTFLDSRREDKRWSSITGNLNLSAGVYKYSILKRKQDKMWDRRPLSFYRQVLIVTCNEPA
jgi:hypothetical protein